MPGNVVLVGFSGTGKSTVGRLVAERMGRKFVDVDDRLVARFGTSIAEYFRLHGEPAFRDAEAEEVTVVCGGHDAVVALGGGAIVRDASFAAACERNLLIRLTASPDTIVRRLMAQPHVEDRPMLAGRDPRERVEGLLAARESRYAQAHITVDTDRRSADEVAELVFRAAVTHWAL